jgi:enamine deaminase RidA (YjgF/YER057c/UK114 family)
MTIRRINYTDRLSHCTVHNGCAYMARRADDPNADIGEQTRQVLARFDELMAEAGTDKSRLLMVTIYLARAEDFDAMNAVWDEWVDAESPPTRATLLGPMPNPDWKVEMVAVAAV